MNHNSLLFKVLHPRYKTSYFTCAKWPPQWIAAAEAVICKVWTDNYKKSAVLPLTQPGQEDVSLNASEHVGCTFYWRLCCLTLRKAPFGGKKVL